MEAIWFYLTIFIIILFLFFLILNFIDKGKLNKLRRNYDESENKSRSPEGFGIGRATTIDTGESCNEGADESGKQELLQDKPIVCSGEDKPKFKKWSGSSAGNKNCNREEKPVKKLFKWMKKKEKVEQ